MPLKVKFDRITVAVLGNIQSRTLYAATHKQTLRNVNNNIIKPIALGKVTVPADVKAAAVKLQPLINERILKVLPDARPLSEADILPEIRDFRAQLRQEWEAKNPPSKAAPILPPAGPTKLPAAFDGNADPGAGISSDPTRQSNASLLNAADDQLAQLGVDISPPKAGKGPAAAPAKPMTNSQVDELIKTLSQGDPPAQGKPLPAATPAPHSKEAPVAASQDMTELIDVFVRKMEEARAQAEQIERVINGQNGQDAARQNELGHTILQYDNILTDYEAWLSDIEEKLAEEMQKNEVTIAPFDEKIKDDPPLIKLESGLVKAKGRGASLEAHQAIAKIEQQIADRKKKIIAEYQTELQTKENDLRSRSVAYRELSDEKESRIKKLNDLKTKKAAAEQELDTLKKKNQAATGNLPAFVLALKMQMQSIAQISDRMNSQLEKSQSPAGELKYWLEIIAVLKGDTSTHPVAEKEAKLMGIANGHAAIDTLNQEMRLKLLAAINEAAREPILADIAKRAENKVKNIH
jgi:hypothetical protein